MHCVLHYATYDDGEEEHCVLREEHDQHAVGLPQLREVALALGSHDSGRGLGLHLPRGGHADVDRVAAEQQRDEEVDGEREVEDPVVVRGVLVRAGLTGHSRQQHHGVPHQRVHHQVASEQQQGAEEVILAQLVDILHSE